MSLEDTLYIGEMIKTVYRPTAVVPTIVNRSKNSSLLFIKENYRHTVSRKNQQWRCL